MGDPLAPRANVPAAITDLAALQRGAIVYAQFTAPLRTTEGIAITTPLSFELRAGPADPFERDRWLAGAQRFTPIVKGGVALYQIPIGSWAGKTVYLAARAIGSNGKESAWSTIVSAPVVAPPAAPGNLDPTAVAEGVRLTWSGPPGNFRIHRRGPGETPLRRFADVTEESWTDTAIEFGKPYLYLVQRIEKLPDGHEAESDFAQKEITPIDKFPPAAPTALHVSLAPASIEITWQQNTEPDLAGYRVYRAVGDGAFERLAEVSQIPSYSDHAVEAGKAYRYAVTAFDQSNNESDRSVPVSVTMQ